MKLKKIGLGRARIMSDKKASPDSSLDFTENIKSNVKSRASTSKNDVKEEEEKQQFADDEDDDKDIKNSSKKTSETHHHENRQSQ